MHSRQGDGVTPELRATRTANLTVEVKKAIAKKDLRFLGVAGYSIMVPGVIGEGSNPIVSIRGIHTIEGTSDFIQSSEQGHLQRHAYAYAMQYNRLLFAHLLRVNDPAVVQTRRRIDKELRRMEQSDPIRDATEAIQKASYLTLIQLPDDTVPGIDAKALEAVQRELIVATVFAYEMWPLVFVKEIMTPMQRQQLMLETARYIVPYNRYIFAHHQPYLKKERERLRDVLSKMKKAPR